MMVDNFFQISLESKMDLLLLVHELDGKGIFVESHASDSFSVPVNQCDFGILLQSGCPYLHSGRSVNRKARAGVTNGLRQVVCGHWAVCIRKIGTQASALPIEHMAAKTVPTAKEDVSSVLNLEWALALCLTSNDPQKGDNVQDLFVPKPEGRHVVDEAFGDRPEEGSVTIAVPKTSGFQARSMGSTMPVGSMAPGTVGIKQLSSSLNRLLINS